VATAGNAVVEGAAVRISKLLSHTASALMISVWMASTRMRAWGAGADLRENVKTIQNLTRFTRRGYAAARSEWLFSCAVHNLCK